MSSSYAGSRPRFPEWVIQLSEVDAVSAFSRFKNGCPGDGTNFHFLKCFHMAQTVQPQRCGINCCGPLSEAEGASRMFLILCEPCTKEDLELLTHEYDHEERQKTRYDELRAKDPFLYDAADERSLRHICIAVLSRLLETEQLWRLGTIASDPVRLADIQAQQDADAEAQRNAAAQAQRDARQIARACGRLSNLSMGEVNEAQRDPNSEEFNDWSNGMEVQD
ncbi:hypothetical protein NA57DRAFT_70723 [Rhizodiscina lignyota]|uniref:Uncharacterized protein n=1 Tax=Rhizodiscina lignyota TaxID=1504668 RepID=A0A9P4MAX5_9PEZI|nr:hypothetical protein NA57DRAFT_70723 [Rhizodiscina lignyota]